MKNSFGWKAICSQLYIQEQWQTDIFI